MSSGEAGSGGGYLWMGGSTHKVPLALFRKNRCRLAAELRKACPAASVVLLQGGSDSSGLNETDADDWAFQQEAYFHWAFGVQEPDCFATLEVDSGRATLFVPRLHPSYAVWMGKINGPEHFRAKYEVDDVRYVPQLKETLAEMAPAKVLLLHGQNTDTGLFCRPASFEGLEKFPCDEAALHPVIAELRVFKTQEEQDVLRYAAKISCDAHKAIMSQVVAGKWEYQMESVFRHSAYHDGGARHVGYCCIAASGPNNAVMHYGHAAAPNNRQLQDGDLCLFDMGASYMRYTADVTNTFPVSGKFTGAQRVIYEAVLAASSAVFALARPGVSWLHCHEAGERAMLGHLRQGGLLKGSVEEMMEARLGATFQPAGLGHLIGIDVHDVHGYPQGGVPRPTQDGLRNLRTARVLQKDMYVTIEPGCYFIDALLDAALADPAKARFLVPEKIASYRGFGGVRIEDDVLVTADGVENFSVLPRTVEDVEAFMAEHNPHCA